LNTEQCQLYMYFHNLAIVFGLGRRDELNTEQCQLYMYFHNLAIVFGLGLGLKAKICLET